MTRLLVLLVLLSAAACAPVRDGGPAASAAADHAILARGDQPAAPPAGDDGQRRVIASMRALASVFRAYAGQAPPAVDFGDHRVVLVDLGPRPSAGHAVGIAAVRVTEAGVAVEVVARRPGADCMSAAVMTRPWVIARIPAAGGPVRFEQRVGTVACG